MTLNRRKRGKWASLKVVTRPQDTADHRTRMNEDVRMGCRSNRQERPWNRVRHSQENVHLRHLSSIQYWQQNQEYFEKMYQKEGWNEYCYDTKISIWCVLNWVNILKIHIFWSFMFYPILENMRLEIFFRIRQWKNKAKLAHQSCLLSYSDDEAKKAREMRLQ